MPTREVDRAQQALDELGELHQWAAAVDAAASALTEHLSGAGDWSKATPAMARKALVASGLPAEVKRLREALRWVTDRYEDTLAQRSVRDADEAILHARSLLDAS